MMVRQVKYAFDLLEFFAQRRSPATLTEISDHFGWPRSSTFNLIETLAQTGYLHEPRLRGGYYPTRRLLSLANTISASEPLPEELTDAVLTLARTTGETAILGAITGHQAIYLDVVESEQSIRYFAKPGDMVPMYATSIGRALMSMMSDKEVADILSRTEFRKFAENTPTSAAQVRDLLLRVRRLGYSLNDNGYQPHLLGVALPFDLQGRRMALMVAGPSFRMKDDVPALVARLRLQVNKSLASHPNSVTTRASAT
jgi:DNA-binding IclR family transcriptional regulator